MRVRSFELRLLGSALVACWAASSGLILLTYRPGGPLDMLVGLTAMGPIAIAVAGVVWPPVARGDQAFSAILWMAIGAILFLVPSIIGLFDQLTAYGSQTLLPSVEGAYPWLVALVETSLFTGFGLARRLHGPAAMRRERLLAGVVIAGLATGLSGGAFGAAAVANESALRDLAVTTSRFGPTDGPDQPPLCNLPLAAGSTARLVLAMNGRVDLRPIGTVDLTGLRVDRDFRWVAYVASSDELGEYAAARIGDEAWLRTPTVGWRPALQTTVATDSIDVQVLDVALSPENRATAEDHGVEVLEGARARRCRVAVDGDTFRDAFPQVRWLVGSADLHRWRGQLDYWIFLDGEIGQVAGEVEGDAGEIVPRAVQGTVQVLLTATERGRGFVLYPPPRR
ncbi:MAG: hypothetical protein ACXWWR_06245 [Candidatus Limnocylindrales bacterium]